MELLVPGLGFLLFGVAVAFFFIPKLAPTVLMTGSAIAIIVALYLHYKQFGNNEYSRSTWQNNLKLYARYVMIAAVIFGAYTFYVMNKSEPMPPITMPSAGEGFSPILRNATSRINGIAKNGLSNVM